jgi:hypothetical protein
VLRHKFGDDGSSVTVFLTAKVSKIDIWVAPDGKIRANIPVHIMAPPTCEHEHEYRRFKRQRRPDSAVVGGREWTRSRCAAAG